MDRNDFLNMFWDFLTRLLAMLEVPANILSDVSSFVLSIFEVCYFLVVVVFFAIIEIAMTFCCAVVIFALTFILCISILSAQLAMVLVSWLFCRIPLCRTTKFLILKGARLCYRCLVKLRPLFGLRRRANAYDDALEAQLELDEEDQPADEMHPPPTVNTNYTHRSRGI